MNLDHEMIALLRDSAERYAADNYGFLQRRAFLNDGYNARAWHDYAELGWLALRMPEEFGGMNADAAAIAALIEVVGSRLLLEPLFASAIVGTGLLLKCASAAQQAELLPRLADGSLKLAYAGTDDTAPGADCEWRDGFLNGRKIGVLHGDLADRLIVAASDAEGKPALCLVDMAAPQVARRPYRLVDGRGAANIEFTAAPARLLEAASGRPLAEAIAAADDEATVALCAEALGIMRSLVATTCEYLKVRKQFGKPIGSNQALQHRAVEMFLLQQEAAALTAAAQRALALPVAERSRIVSGARAYIIDAARHVANEAIQMHGGLGITDELEVSHYFRRLMVNAALFGGRDRHFLRFTAQ